MQLFTVGARGVVLPRVSSCRVDMGDSAMTNLTKGVDDVQQGL